MISQLGEERKKRVSFCFNTNFYIEDIAEQNIAEFNIARTKPSEYIKKIESLIPNIQPAGEGKKGFLFSLEKLPKVTLSKGEPAFREIIEKLKTQAPCDKLTIKKELSLEIPEKEEYKNDFINELFNKKKEELAGSSFKNITCHYDIGSSNAEISAALQVVDDSNFKGARRNNILNPAFKYVGFGSAKVKTKHYCFFVFAE